MNFYDLPSLENTKVDVSIPFVLFQDIDMEEEFLPLIKPSILVLNSGEDFTPVKETTEYSFTTYYKLTSNSLGTLLEGYFEPYSNIAGQDKLYAFNEELILQYPSYALHYRDSMLSPVPAERIPDMSIIEYVTGRDVILKFNPLLPDVIYTELYNLPSDASLGTVLTFTINHPDVMYLGKTITPSSYNYNGICFMQTNRNDDNEGIKYKLMVFGSLNTKTNAVFTTTAYKRTKITATWDGAQWNQVVEYEDFTKNTGYTNNDQVQAKVKLYTALRNNNQYNQTKKNV